MKPIFFIGESLGWQEILLIGTLALIFLGPKRLPQVARKIGKTLAEIKRAGQEFRRAWEQEAGLTEEEKILLRNPLAEESLALAEEKYSSLPQKEIASKDAEKNLETTVPNILPSETVEEKERLLDSEKTIPSVNQKQNWL